MARESLRTVIKLYYGQLKGTNLEKPEPNSPAERFNQQYGINLFHFFSGELSYYLSRGRLDVLSLGWKIDGKFVRTTPLWDPHVVVTSNSSTIWVHLTPRHGHDVGIIGVTIMSLCHPLISHFRQFKFVCSTPAGARRQY